MVTKINQQLLQEIKGIRDLPSVQNGDRIALNEAMRKYEKYIQQINKREATLPKRLEEKQKLEETSNKKEEEFQKDQDTRATAQSVSNVTSVASIVVPVVGLAAAAAGGIVTLSVGGAIALGAYVINKASVATSNTLESQIKQDIPLETRAEKNPNPNGRIEEKEWFKKCKSLSEKNEKISVTLDNFLVDVEAAYKKAMKLKQHLKEAKNEMETLKQKTESLDQTKSNISAAKTAREITKQIWIAIKEDPLLTKQLLGWGEPIKNLVKTAPKTSEPEAGPAKG